MVEVNGKRKPQLERTGNASSSSQRRRPLPARPLLPFADPKANYWAHKEAIDAAVRRVLESGWYILGPEVIAFEQEFAAAMGQT